VPVAQGNAMACVDALKDFIDPYTEPFRLKTANGNSRVVRLRTAKQRSVGESSIVSERVH
jgi:hypothetical protein